MLRALLISLMILGCFASFAQNAWGNTLRVAMVSSLGILFLWEFFVSVYKNKFKVRGLAGFLNQQERFAFFLMSLGDFLKYNHWPIASVSLVLGGFFLVLSQLILAGYWPYQRGLKPVARIAFVIMTIATLGSVVGFVFKMQHWPSADITCFTGVVITSIYGLYLFWVRYLGREKLAEINRHSTLHPNGLFYMLFFGGWALFMVLNSWVPGTPTFYTSYFPNDVYKCWDSGDSKKAEQGNSMAEFTDDQLWPTIQEAEESWTSSESEELEQQSQK
jgi:hypothetical protein